jgi:hypothetical protein
VLLKGRPEAMWGMQNATLSTHAVVWTALSDTAVRFPLAVVRRARDELALMAEKVSDLYATVGRDDDRAMVFARTLGFTIVEGDDPAMILLRFGAQ